MNRNEFFEALPISRVTAKLIGGTLEVCTDEIDDIHVMVSGADRDVNGLRIVLTGDQLLVEQPAMSLAKNPVATSWLQVTLRLPLNWKGRIDGRTVSGLINARTLTGTDLTLESVSGMITAHDLSFITACLRSVTGDVKVTCLGCDKCTLGTTSGDISALGSILNSCTIASITGNASLALQSPFTEISATTVSGDVAIDAPISECNAVLRSVSGRIRTSGISILDTAEAKVHVTSVSGGLDLCQTQAGE